MDIQTKIYLAVRHRIIGVLNIIDGLDHIILGRDTSGGLTIKVLFWELSNPWCSKFIRRWQEHRDKEAL